MNVNEMLTKLAVYTPFALVLICPVGMLPLLVTNNWNSGYNFRSVIENNWYYYPITDPEQATKNLGKYTHQYVDTVLAEILQNLHGKIRKSRVFYI